MNLFEIRDANGKVYNRVENPAVLFDKEDGTLHKIGEREIIEAEYERMHKAFMDSGQPGMAEKLITADLPDDQEEIDRIFQNTGYVLRFYNDIMADIQDQNRY